MTGRGRTAFAAWAATLAAACALLPLVEVDDWLLQAALLLGLVSAAGVVARRLRTGPVVAAVLQLILTVVLLTVVTVPQYAAGGFIPGPLAWDEFTRLFGAGAEDVGNYVSPAPLTDGIRILLLCSVLGIGLLVDLLAVALRSAAAAGLPLLGLYSAAAAIAEDGAGGQYFLLAAAGFLTLLLSEHRGRLVAWGRYFPAPPPHQPGGWGSARGAAAGNRTRVRHPQPRLRTGRRIGAVALGAALAAPLALPALGEGLLDPGEHGPGGGSGGSSDSGDVAVDPVVALQDQLNQPSNRTLLTYETDSDEPGEMYLRLMALDEFTGDEWRSTGEITEEIPQSPWSVLGLDPEVPTTEATTTFTADTSYAQQSLPVPVPAVNVTASGDWAYDTLSRTLRTTGSSRTAGRTWEVDHLVVEPEQAQLEQAPEPSAQTIRDHFTHVPGHLPDVVRKTAVDVTADAGSSYEQAVALQDWFLREGGFRYDTDVASGTGSEAVAQFLQDREGFCVHFAFTMAAMARTLDIPAQVSVGFSPGSPQLDGTFEVGAHNAHAWPELYFEGVGWIRFEPTPGQGTPPAYSRPDAEDGEDTERGDADEPDRPDHETEEDLEREAPDRPPENEDQNGPSACDPMLSPEECSELFGEGAAESDDGAAVAWPVLWGAGGALLAIALALTPVLWRRRLRRRRLAPGAGALGAWEELVDSAWDYGMPPAPAETPRQTAERLVRAADLRQESDAAAALWQLTAAVERELYAPVVGVGLLDEEAPGTGSGHRSAVGEWATAVRTLQTAFRAVVPSALVRARTRVLPGSTIRVMSGVVRRWSRIGERAVHVTGRAVLPPWRRSPAADRGSHGSSWG